MTRLIIAVARGAVLTPGGTALVTKILVSQADGAPVPARSSRCRYGAR